MINDNEISNNFNYIWIKNFSRIVSTHVLNHNTKKYICDICLNYVYNETKLKQHGKYCDNRNEYNISFPGEQLFLGTSEEKISLIRLKSGCVNLKYNT